MNDTDGGKVELLNRTMAISRCDKNETLDQKIVGSILTWAAVLLP